MMNINGINRVKETYVVNLDNIPDFFPTRQSAEFFLKEELEESFRLGYITRMSVMTSNASTARNI